MFYVNAEACFNNTATIVRRAELEEKQQLALYRRINCRLQESTTKVLNITEVETVFVYEPLKDLSKEYHVVYDPSRSSILIYVDGRSDSNALYATMEICQVQPYQCRVGIYNLSKASKEQFYLALSYHRQFFHESEYDDAVNRIQQMIDAF